MSKDQILSAILKHVTTHIAFDKERGLSHFRLIDGIHLVTT